MKIVIIHGTGGSPDGNWFAWLGDKLTQTGHQVYIPKMPTPENQSLKSWTQALQDQVPVIDNETVLIGHSCGATYLLHILETLPIPVSHSIFVSGFIDKLGNEFFDNLNETFVNHDFDWDKIQKNAGKITLFQGDNDPYVPLAAAQKLSNFLEVPLTLIKNGGHLNAEFGFIEFPPILNILK